MKRKMKHKEMKKLMLKVVSDCRILAQNHIKNWRPLNKNWDTINGAVYLRLSDDSQVAVERGSLEQQIHISVAEASYRSEQERINYKITEFYIEPGITGTHDNRPEFIRLQHNINLKEHRFVIFKEISRLVRDVEIWKRFFRLCQRNDCEICIRGLPFNPNDPASILQLDQLAAYAEFESRTTSKRIKESNHSALITSGKFNGGNPLLGFDMTKTEFGENSGIHRPNKEELKIVQWIMESFLRADKYRTLLDWCKDKNIKSKLGVDLNQSSIKALLQNPRYIGKWYRNKHNKDKRQNKLMPYDRYVEVSLSHGPVIDKDLWERVQGKIKRLSESRARGKKRCFPLSGILQYEDGSTFVGSSAWGSSTVCTYYHNVKHRMRIKTGILEDEAQEAMLDIIDSTERFQKSFSNYLGHQNNSLHLLEEGIGKIDATINDISSQNSKMEKRLDFLLESDDKEDLELFKEDHQKQYVANKRKAKELEMQRDQLKKTKELLKNRLIDRKSYLAMAANAVKQAAKKDLISLKSIYRSIFKKIIIRPKSPAEVQMKFIFNDPTSTSHMEDVFFCISNGLVGRDRIELPTSTL